jgi:transcriptional regulator with XRE-family HTH domain
MYRGVNMAYYPRLKDLREDNDKTQKQVAEILFITQQQYSLYEKGYREIPSSALITLANFYGVSVDYILGLTDNPTKN